MHVLYQENHDALIKCLLEDNRYDKNRPVAACIVYRTLIQWRSFEADKTNIFDRIIHAIQSSIEVTKQEHKCSTYNCQRLLQAVLSAEPGQHKESGLLAVNNFNSFVSSAKNDQGEQLISSSFEKKQKFTHLVFW